MDPFTALIFAALVGWGVTSSGVRDTLAVAKGQTPPGHAERMAKIAAQEHVPAGVATGPSTGGYVGPPSAETRRIRVADLVRHWWEQALEDADDWRQHRHDTRPERKAARKRRQAERKQREATGTRLLREWAERTLNNVDTPADGSTESPAPTEAPTTGEEPTAADTETEDDVRSEVRDAQERAERDRATDSDEFSGEQRSAGSATKAPPDADAGAEEAADSQPTDPPEPGPNRDKAKADEEAQRSRTEARARRQRTRERLLVDQILKTEARQSHVVATDVTPPTPDPEPMKALPTPRDEGTNTTMPTLNLSDANSLDSHCRALQSYGSYYDGIARDLEQLAAGMRHHQMGHSTVGAVDTASAAHAEAATACRTAAETLQAGHQVVADAFTASPDAADGDYNKQR